MPTDANQSKKSNYSMKGDSSTQIDVANAPLSSESWTISVWLKPKVITGTEIIWNMQYGAADGGGFKLIHQYGTGSSTAVWFLYYAPGYSNFSSQITVTKDNWHHVIVRYNKGVDYRIYVDGILSGIKTGATVNYTWPTTRNLEIFNTNYPNTGGGFNGSLNQFCIFNYALSDTSTTVGDTATGQVASLWGGGTEVSNPMALPRSPVAYYPLGTSAWNTQYLAENNAIGNYVFDFNNSQEINCGSNASLNQVGSVFTMSCWINTTSNARGCIMGTYNSTLPKNYTGYYIDLMGDGTVQGGYHQGVQYYLRGSNSSVRDGRWHHVCYVSSSAADGYLNVYIDGVLDQNALQPSTPPPANANSTDPFKINSAGYIARYIGKTSNVQVFSTALSAAEVETLYNYGSPLQTLASIPQNTNLEGWWKLDASASFISGTWAIPDDSENSNGGASTGMSQSNLVQSDLQTVAPYSKYAMNFDGTDRIDVASIFGSSVDKFTVNFWVKFDTFLSSGFQQIISEDIWIGQLSNKIGLDITNSNSIAQNSTGGSDTGLQMDIPISLRTNNWLNISISLEGSSVIGAGASGTIKMYLNGAKLIETSAAAKNWASGPCNLKNNGINGFDFGRRSTSNGLNGQLSNIAFWNTNLSDAQVKEVYNEGLPSNLNTFSGIAPVAWWQLGENSSYEGGWKFADEVGTNNGSGDGLSEIDLTNGVGTTANGLSFRMSEGNLVGDAPYSAVNALSSNMVITSRVTGSGNTP